MSLWRLWWLTILVPALLAGALDHLRHQVLPGYLYRFSEPVNTAFVVFSGAALMTLVVSTYMERHKSRLLNTARDFANLWDVAGRDARQEGGAAYEDPGVVAGSVVERVAAWLRVDGCAIVLADEAGERLAGSRGLDEPQVARLLQESRKAEGREARSPWRKGLDGFRWSAVVPVQSSSRDLGWLLLASHVKPLVHARDGAVLKLLGQQLGALFENLLLSRRVHQLAAVEERSRLSREIHDSLAQDLGYLTVKLEALQGGEPPGPIAVELAEMLEVVRSAYMDVREWVGGLRESQSPGLGLVGFLERAVESFGRTTGIKTSLRVRGGPWPGLAPEVDIQLIRVVQEALANVRKHSRASRATVTLEHDGAEARVAVEDNGVGFSPSQASGQGHYGLQTMKERTEGVGGSLKVTSHPGNGSRVEVVLPVRAREVRIGAD